MKLQFKMIASMLLLSLATVANAQDDDHPWPTPDPPPIPVPPDPLPPNPLPPAPPTPPFPTPAIVSCSGDDLRADIFEGDREGVYDLYVSSDTFSMVWTAVGYTREDQGELRYYEADGSFGSLIYRSQPDVELLWGLLSWQGREYDLTCQYAGAPPPPPPFYVLCEAEGPDDLSILMMETEAPGIVFVEIQEWDSIGTTEGYGHVTLGAGRVEFHGEWVEYSSTTSGELYGTYHRGFESRPLICTIGSNGDDDAPDDPPTN